MALIALGQLLSGFASPDAAGAWETALGFSLAGVGLGLGTAPVNNVAMANAPKERAGTASGLLNTARMVGATLGVAMLGAVFAQFAGQGAAAEGIAPGLRAALAVAGFTTSLGAAVAFLLIPAPSGRTAWRAMAPAPKD